MKVEFSKSFIKSSKRLSGSVKTIEGRFSKKDIIYPYTYYHNTSDTPQK